MKGHQELKPVQGLPVDEEELRKAVDRAHGKLICWTISGIIGGNTLQQSLDIGVFMAVEQSRIAASKGASRKLIDVAEAAGYSREICGYHKVTIGYALLLARGQLDPVSEVPTMPRPDFIWTNNGCQSNLWTGEALGRILDVPVIGINLPFEHDIADRGRILDYLERQFREALDILETWVGRPFDWPRLTEHIRGLAEVAAIRNQVTQMCMTCPSVCSALDLIPATRVHNNAPVVESKRVYEELREEIKGKIEKGERDVPDERIRIMWGGGSFPWGKTEAIRKLLARHGATLCSSQSSVGSPAHRGEGLDPGNPLRTVAWLYDSTGVNKSIDARIEDSIKPCVKGYNVDGAIFHMSRTCKIMGIPYLATAAELEKELGVPTLIVESDAVDPAFYDENQIENRIESFLESIACRKGGL